MKGTESGKDKVKRICDILRKETLEPAQHEANEIVSQAELKAEQIVSEARAEGEKIKSQAREEMERQKNGFISSLQQASKQAVETLKQNIDEKLFNPGLSALLAKGMQQPKVRADLITALLKAIEKEGIHADLSVYVPAAVPARMVNELLSQEILGKLKEKGVLVGDFAGGIAVKLKQDNITIDLTDAALKGLLATYIRKDFRELFFGSI